MKLGLISLYLLAIGLSGLVAFANNSKTTSDPVVTFLSSLNNEDAQVRQKAAWALGQIGATDEVTISALNGATKDPNELVRESATAALKEIHKSGQPQALSGTEPF